MNEAIYLMWLTRIDGLGIKKQYSLLDKFKTGKEIYFASEKDLIEADSISKTIAAKITYSKKNVPLEKFEEELEKFNVKFVTKYDDNYPSLLKTIYDHPIGIYVKGNLPDDSLPKISVIGSRRCTEYGLTVTHKISKDLASNGVVIVSGMARGIDTQAHVGALDANGYTIAVLGCGTNVCYPAENRSIMEKIQKKGCIISEFPPETKPLPGYFPLRNRIISGISSGLLVVEASDKSGTMITVDEALDQGRTVFAIPGNVTSKYSTGTNKLIQDGAVLTKDYQDILNELSILPNKLDNKINEENQFLKEFLQSDLDKDEILVYKCISYEPITIKDIVTITKSPVSQIQYILTILEIKGYIKKISGQRYIKAL